VETLDGEKGRERLVRRGYVDGERLLELQTLEAGESSENFENFLGIWPLMRWNMGNGEVYEVTSEERR
jgi:hypothetical protein